MAVSFGKAVKNICSEKYDKNNLLSFIIFTILALILGSVPSIPGMLAKKFDFSFESNPMFVPILIGLILLLLLYFWVLIYLEGMSVLAIKNISNKETDIFPNLNVDKKKIWKIGVNYVGGVIAWGLIIGFSLPFLAIVPLAFFAFTLVMIIGVFLYGPLLYISFCTTHKLADLFNFVKATKILIDNTKNFLILYLKLFLTFVIGISLYLCIGLLSTLIVVLIAFLTGMSSEIMTVLLVLPIFLTLTTITICTKLIFIDLFGQFLLETSISKKTLLKE